MLKKLSITIFCLSVICACLSGCWNRYEPKDLALITSTLYDKQSNNKYEVTLEFLNPVQSASGSQQSTANKTYIVTTDGNSTQEALRSASVSVNKVLYFAHNRARFFSEKLARDDFTVLLDLFARDRQSRQTVYMAVIKGDNPKLIYKAQTGLAETVGDYIEGLSKAQPGELSSSVYTTLLDFMRDYYEDGKEPVLTCIEIVPDNAPKEKDSSKSESSSNEQKYKIKLDGLAAFKGDRLVGFMDGNETRAYNMVTNNLKGAIISVPFRDKDTVLDVYSSKCKNKIEIKDNQATINIDVKVGTSISGIGGTSDITHMDVLKEIEQSFNSLLEKQISGTVQKAQKEFKSDIFGFGLPAHYQNPKEWKKAKNNWNDIFSNAKINVKVESTIYASGEFKEPFKLED